MKMLEYVTMTLYLSTVQWLHLLLLVLWLEIDMIDTTLCYWSSWYSQNTTISLIILWILIPNNWIVELGFEWRNAQKTYVNEKLIK